MFYQKIYMMCKCYWKFDYQPNTRELYLVQKK